MKLQERAVTVKQLPKMLHHRQRSAFLSDVTNSLDVDRPCIVLDCSTHGHIDEQTIHLLLCCLEEAMKRNGDIRLAAVSVEAKASLKAAEADALFTFFETSTAAVASFQRRALTHLPREAVHSDFLHEFKEAV